MKRKLADGRRVYGKDEVGEMPDIDVPCPECGRPWDEHSGGGAVSLYKLKDGSAGFVMPKCLPPSGPLTRTSQR